ASDSTRGSGGRAARAVPYRGVVFWYVSRERWRPAPRPRTDSLRCCINSSEERIELCLPQRRLRCDEMTNAELVLRDDTYSARPCERVRVRTGLMSPDSSPHRGGLIRAVVAK